MAVSMRGASWLVWLLWSESALAFLLRLGTWLVVSEWLAYARLMPADDNQRNTLLYLAIIFLIKTFLLRRLETFPGGRSAGYRLALTAGLFAGAFFVIVALRLGYGRGVLFVGMGLLLVSELVLSLLRQQLEITRYVLIPPVLLNYTSPNNMRVQQPTYPEQVEDGVLVVEPDAHMTESWLRFIARASAAGRRVISCQQLQEKVTGRVVTQELAVVELEALAPSWVLLATKRLIDLVLVLVLLPLALPLALVVALAVCLDSPGGALYRQARIGMGNRTFNMFKFRSMRADTTAEVRFASDESDRITRLGFFIRATHLDELPQLFNVLRGDMSLVGPRPEQPQFVDLFEQELPFYRYRHLVRPGITGWAQVCQGYAADTDATREKLSYDFFYIKHLSLWLDILILVRTIRSVLFDRHPERKPPAV